MAGRTCQWVCDVHRWSTASQDIAEQHADLGVGLADASLVGLAPRLETTNIATFDGRHFHAMRPEKEGAAFRLLPAMPRPNTLSLWP